MVHRYSESLTHATSRTGHSRPRHIRHVLFANGTALRHGALPKNGAASAVAVVLRLLWLTNSHISSTRISSPAGGVEGAAASSFMGLATPALDRLRDGWRPCPYESRDPGDAASGSGAGRFRGEYSGAGRVGLLLGTHSEAGRVGPLFGAGAGPATASNASSSRLGIMGQARSPAWSAFTPEARVRDADE